MKKMVKFSKAGTLSLLLLGVPILTIIVLSTATNSEKTVHEEDIECVFKHETHFYMDSLTHENVKAAILYYELKFPRIVYAQAILETGHFKSKVCREKNNLFGLYDSRKEEYFSFGHWTGSIEMYKRLQGKYKGNGSEEDYYKWLDELGYAEAEDYVDKVRRIVDGIDFDKQF